MTRSELISKLSSIHRDLNQDQIDAMVSQIFGDIANTLKNGGRVELRGFGTFSLRHRSPRTGRNPRTGESVLVEGKSVPFFKAGKELKQLLNAS